MQKILSGLNGPRTLGNGPLFWLSFWVLVGVAACMPVFLGSFAVSNVTFFLVWTFMALGLSLMWGYGGILSFGQTAFFGLAGYTYGIFSLNAGDTPVLVWVSLFVALLAPVLLALVLGYFIFYGGIRDVFVGIVTLSVTLVFETFMAQTAGPEWAIGEARLNGFNGMSGMPLLSIIIGERGVSFDGTPFYWLVLALVILTYLGLRLLVNSSFGRVLVAIQGNPDRVEMLGYNVRLHQLITFTIGGGLAGLSGVMYTLWGSYITPSSMSLNAASLPIIWVAAGGRKDLTAVLVATLALTWVSQQLAVYGSQYALILMGFLLICVVMGAPEGFVVSLVAWFKRRLARKNQTA
ncbi:MAG: ABC transporter permease [Deltaproteobacteria bacterium]|nr:ABC transporter permease [Deltaproteobacteria bacterium]